MNFQLFCRKERQDMLRNRLTLRPIDIFAISNGDHLNRSCRIVHDIQDAIVANSHAVFLTAAEFLATLRTRFVSRPSIFFETI